MSLLRQSYGIARSLVTYYGNPFQVARMAAFYAQFIRPGDLCFDVGAHVGNRIAAWSRLGARVVAVEPQRTFARLLRLLYGRRRGVELVESALGAVPGEQVMLISDREPTVSTLSAEWASRVRRVKPSFARTRWDRAVVVPVSTLDELVGRYGRPAFCKVDTEGFELEVLKGLSTPVRALSFEFIPPTVELGAACLERLDALGPYEYNWSSGETMALHFAGWVDAGQLASYLASLPAEEVPGDVYARLRGFDGAAP